MAPRLVLSLGAAMISAALFVTDQATAQTFAAGVADRASLAGVDFRQTSQKKPSGRVREDFDALQTVIRDGDKVTVLDTSGNAMTGRVVSISASGLTLLVEKRQFQLGADTIRQVARWHKQPGKGLRFGAGIGALFGLVLGLAAPTSEEYSSTFNVLAGTGFGAMMGAIYGTVIGSFVNGTTVVYAVPQGMPIVVPTLHGGEVRFSFRF